MSTPERLMGVGLSDEVAKRIGFFIQTPLSTQESRTINGPGNQLIVVSNASASLILGENFDLGDEVLVCAHAAASVYPASTHYIWPSSAGAVRAVSADVNRVFIKTAASAWHVIASV